ncbi:MAG: NHLP bacteriocin export ABC transporter permease/ATPase subunit [Clostridiales bacterium]|nr:NHLP bacteriocin export ABC transporter permease/ATPase subunit [Clostridiales bacterium]
MGWFEGQINERQDADLQLLEDSFVKVAGIINGKRFAEQYSDSNIITKTAIDEVLKYYHFKSADIPSSITETDKQLDYCLRPHGMMYRSVELSEGWYNDAFGPILAFRKDDGRAVALIPGTISGYTYYDAKRGKRMKLNRRTQDLFEKDAICFYRPLPQKKLGIKDLILYMKSCLTFSDIFMIVIASLAVSGIGLFMPRITKMLTGPVLNSGSTRALMCIALAIVFISLSSQLISSTKNMIMTRLDTKTSLGVQASMMIRLMSLPASFFRKYNPGELKNRSMSVNALCSTLMSMVLGTGLMSVTSLVYITQIFNYAKSLVIPSLIIIITTVAFSVASTLLQIKINRQQMDIAAKESGLSYSLITGVQKIKLSGAEKRVFAKWLDLYSEDAALTYDPPVFIKANAVITTAISLISNIVLYYISIKNGIDQSSYFAFMTAYNMLMGAFMSVSGIALSVASIQPILEMAEPFLETEPETADNKEIVTRLSGSIELDHVSFRYTEDMPYVLDDLSLKINNGDYIAIVGRTGCGKSTLVRLLLGFEKPEKGSVFYDGRDISSLDLTSLRRKIGTVTQDAGLFQGDIYSNIVITAPELTLNDAWEAAEKAGVADDIRAMPMGMNTIISEGQGGISGGQRQRIMIARAIAPKPKILIFDEATSALDNKTQKMVNDSLDSMGCTRIVIAHRLSTIKHCDRILVLDGGKIIEDGTYDDLIAKNGYFAELVERQKLDTGSN